MSDLRILQVIAPAPFGGLESVVSQLAAGLAEAGHRVGLVATLEPAAEEPAFLAALAARQVEVTVLRARRRAYRAEARRLAEIAVASRAQILHSHGPRSDWLVGPLARRLDRRCFSTLHGFVGDGWKSRLSRALQLRALARFDGVIAVSQPIRDALQAAGVPEARLHRLPNAFVPRGEPVSREQARSRLGLPADGAVVGFLGRLGREKGADVLLEALARLGADAPHAVFVGDGAEAGRLRSRGAALGLAGRLHWPGALPEAARLLSAFDVLALPSRTEGTPMALFEALAAGVPVVASRVGGVPDVVGEAEARLVLAEDPDALARALAAALADPAEGRRRAERARQRLAAEFDPAPWLERHQALYREALSGSGSSVSPASLTVAGRTE